MNCTRAKRRPVTDGERPRDQRLGEARVVLDQHVPVREQAEQHELQRVALAHDRELDLVEDPGGAFGDLGGPAHSASRASRISPSRRGGIPGASRPPRRRSVGAHEVPDRRAEQAPRLLGVPVQPEAPPGEAGLGDLDEHRPQARVGAQAALARPLDDALEPHELGRPRIEPDARPLSRSSNPPPRAGSLASAATPAPAPAAAARMRSASAATLMSGPTVSSREQAQCKTITAMLHGPGGLWSTAAMQANGVRTAAVVLALTTLVGAAAIAGNEPVRHYPPEPPPAEPQRARGDRGHHVGLPGPGRPAPGGLPARGWGLDTGPDLTWLLVVMTAAGLVGLLAVAFALVPQLLRWRPRWPRLRWRGLQRRRRGERPATEPTVDEPSPADAEADAEVARRALDSALVALREPADPRASGDRGIRADGGGPRVARARPADSLRRRASTSGECCASRACRNTR